MDVMNELKKAGLDKMIDNFKTQQGHWSTKLFQSQRFDDDSLTLSFLCQAISLKKTFYRKSYTFSLKSEEILESLKSLKLHCLMEVDHQDYLDTREYLFQSGNDSLILANLDAQENHTQFLTLYSLDEKFVKEVDKLFNKAE